MELKFRAWHKEHEEYWDVMSILFNSQELELYEWGNVRFDEVIIEQYTGIKDKNGVEIYEGDILKISDGVHTTFEEVYYGVDKGENYPAYTITNLEWKFSANPFSELLDSTTDYEFVVVGNIHENPEITGGKRK